MKVVLVFTGQAWGVKIPRVSQCKTYIINPNKPIQQSVQDILDHVASPFQGRSISELTIPEPSELAPIEKTRMAGSILLHPSETQLLFPSFA